MIIVTFEQWYDGINKYSDGSYQKETKIYKDTNEFICDFEIHKNNNHNPMIIKGFWEVKSD